MFDDDTVPSPHQLADDPELAVLAVLDIALAMATNALLAAHPLLCAADEDRTDDGPAWVAEGLLAQARGLTDTLEIYRHALRVVEQRRNIRCPAKHA